MPSLRFALPNQPDEHLYVLDGTRISIGRGADNTIQIADRSVSAHHAELILIRGHYRLHDLDSTNLSCVDGCPVSDFHLHLACQVRFGNIECEFSPDATADLGTAKNAHAPTQSEIDFLKRDNLDLQKQVEHLRRQVEILGEAPLMPLDREQTTVSLAVLRRVVAERDALLRENTALKRDASNFHCDLETVLRDRDALRQAWATAKADLAAQPR